MARASYRLLPFGCMSCNSSFTQGCWLYHDDWDQDKNTPFPTACPSCSSPSIQYIPPNRTIAQVRESQRAVVYQLPDGNYMNLPTTDPSDPSYESSMQIVNSAGGVRREFTSVTELRDFQREQRERKRVEWQRDIDSGGYEGTEPSFQQLQDALYKTSRNDVLDYDDHSRREGRGLTKDSIAARQALAQTARDRFKSMRVGRSGDNERYERLKRGGR